MWETFTCGSRWSKWAISISLTCVVTAVNCGGGMFKVRGRRHNDTVQAATKNVAENAQKIKISKPLPWKANNWKRTKIPIKSLNWIQNAITILAVGSIYEPARKTVASANEAHIPHFKWLGRICVSDECTASTTFADSTARSSGNISLAGRIAFKPNVPCSSSYGKRDWSLIHIQQSIQFGIKKKVKSSILFWEAKTRDNIVFGYGRAYYCWITE